VRQWAVTSEGATLYRAPTKAGCVAWLEKEAAEPLAERKRQAGEYEYSTTVGRVWCVVSTTETVEPEYPDPIPPLTEWRLILAATFLVVTVGSVMLLTAMLIG